ncbi:MAG: DNA-binding protein [Anaerolineaceae bacterium]|nr:MAG: DNA-binding protein [Anaerolineaceae bacterium]
MIDAEQLSTKEAARELGLTESGVNQMIYKELIPSDKIGRRRYVARSIVEAVVDLKNQYGKRWPKHAPWNGGDWTAPEEKPDVPSGLNQELLKLSRKFRSAGHADIALKIQDILLDQYEF